MMRRAGCPEERRTASDKCARLHLFTNIYSPHPGRVKGVQGFCHEVMDDGDGWSSMKSRWMNYNLCLMPLRAKTTLLGSDSPVKAPNAERSA